MNLEKILQKHFNLKGRAFLYEHEIEKNDSDEYIETMTDEGSIAYKKLVDLIYDLENLGIFTNETHDIVDELDRITNEIR